MNRPVGRPSPKRADRAVRGIPAPVVPERPVYTGPPRKITLTEGRVDQTNFHQYQVLLPVLW